VAKHSLVFLNFSHEVLEATRTTIMMIIMMIMIGAKVEHVAEINGEECGVSVWRNPFTTNPKLCRPMSQSQDVRSPILPLFTWKTAFVISKAHGRKQSYSVSSDGK